MELSRTKLEPFSVLLLHTLVRLVNVLWHVTKFYWHCLCTNYFFRIYILISMDFWLNIPRIFLLKDWYPGKVHVRSLCFLPTRLWAQTVCYLWVVDVDLPQLCHLITLLYVWWWRLHYFSFVISTLYLMRDIFTYVCLRLCLLGFRFMNSLCFCYSNELFLSLLLNI